MSTARFAGPAGVTTMMAPHPTGHEWAKDRLGRHALRAESSRHSAGQRFR